MCEGSGILVYVRHGEGLHQKKSLLELRADELTNKECPLTELGVQQIEVTGRYLRGIHGDFDVYYTSSFRRAIHGLEIMFPGVSNTIVSGFLDELWLGVWHTHTEEEICLQFPRDWELRNASDMRAFGYRPTGGDSLYDLFERVEAFYQIVRPMLEAGKKVFVSGHGNWLLMFLALQGNVSVEELNRWFMRKRSEVKIHNASITSFRYNDLNEHLEIIDFNRTL